MPDTRQFTYTYLDKRTHDLAMYGYAFAALAISIFALYRFFPAILAETAGAMMTAVFVVLVSLCALILIWPMLALKKKHRWFIREGVATVTAEGVRFASGTSIAFSNIFRVSCGNASDFGNRYEALRIMYGTKRLQICGVEQRAGGEETALTRLARAIGDACPQLEFEVRDGDLLYRRPAPPENPNAIHFHKR
ncbi:MAG: hypothetical protein Q4E13_01750 [Clostridia bacterium]|nr:hypothetical protein [Clostridia bacterium]